jgi:cystathionine beta-lyase family protein involved in aluminum resistance
VANSIEAFVMSGQTAEVRDFILANLVEAVAAFGVSGLLARETDTLSTHRMPVDTVTRLIGILGAKKEGS